MKNQKRNLPTLVSDYPLKSLLFTSFFTVLVGCKQANNMQTDEDKLNPELITLRKEKDELTKRTTKLENENKTLTQEKNTKNDLLRRAEQANNNFEQRVSHQGTTLTKLQQEEIALQNQIWELQEAISEKTSHIDELQDNHHIQNQQREQQITKLNETITKLEEKRQQKEQHHHSAILKLQETLAAYEQKIKALERLSFSPLPNKKVRIIDNPTLPTSPEEPAKESQTKKLQLEQAIQEAENTIALKQQELTKAKKDIATITQDLKTQEEDKKNNDQQLLQLKNQKKTEQDAQKRGQIKNAIKKLKQDNQAVDAVIKLYQTKYEIFDKNMRTIEATIQEQQKRIGKNRQKNHPN